MKGETVYTFILRQYKQIKLKDMKEVNGQYEGTYAYIIISDGKQIYQSCDYWNQEDALRYGREDAMQRNSHGENVEYDIVRTV